MKHINNYSLTTPSILDLISEFEETFGVENWAVDGLHIWPAIRLPLITLWEEQLDHPSSEFGVRKVSLPERIKTELNNLWLALQATRLNQVPVRYVAEVGVWAYDADRVVVGAMSYSIFADGLQDLEMGNGIGFLCVEHTAVRLTQGYRSNIDITLKNLGVRYAAYLKSRLFPRIKLSFELDEPRKWCASRGLAFEILNSTTILQIYFSLQGMKNNYLHLINKYKLKACLKVCWYGLDGMALAWAAKLAGIPCYDLQHGLAGSCFHRAYCRWTRFPKNGYQIIPDGFWCWTEDDAKAIREWGDRQNPPIKVFIGGNVWMRLWIEEKFPKELLLSFQSNCAFLNNVGPKILFTLQVDKAPAILLDMLKCSPANWNWWIRCHPNQIMHISSIRRSLAPYDNVEIMNTTLAPLPLLLKNADIHITEWSAVVHDAREFGLKSIVCHPSGEKYFQADIESGAVIYLTDPREITNFIASRQHDFRGDISTQNYPSFIEVIA